MNAWIKSLLLASLAVFAPIKAMLITVGIMIVADLILGIWAARKRGEPITSAGFRRTVTKLFIYEVALMLAFLAETYLSDALPLCKLIGAMISLTEMASITENLNEISGQNLLKSIVDKLQSANNPDKKDSNEKA